MRSSSCPSATPAALSAATGMPATAVEATAEHRLRRKGLSPARAPPERRYVAASPAIALGPLVRQRREDLRRAELELAALTERYFVSAADRTAGDLVEVVTGVELIAKRFEQLQAGAREEVRALVTAPPRRAARGQSGRGRGRACAASDIASSSNAPSWTRRGRSRHDRRARFG